MRGRPWLLTLTLGLVVTLSATCLRALVSNLPIPVANDFGGRRGDDESIASKFRRFSDLPLFQERRLAQSC